MKRTYQLRFDANTEQAGLLERYASQFSKIERALFSETVAKGFRPESVKNIYLGKHNITGR